MFMDSVNECIIEWLRGEKQATVTMPNNTRLKSRIVKYAEEYPDKVEITDINTDGSIVAHVPSKWIKISAPRKVSEEQKQVLSERMKKLRGQHLF